MYLTLTMLLKIYGVHKILASLPYIGNLFTQGFVDFFHSFIDGKTKAWRIFYSIFIIWFTLEPQIWWKLGLMIVTVELSVMHIAHPTANWVCNKLGW